MKLEELTALYSPLDIEYSQVMSGPYEDLSYHGEDCTVIAGLKDGKISGGWRPVVAVGDDKSLKLHIERLYDICPNIYYMDFLIDGKLSVISQFLLRHGHRARPYYTQIIDLTKTEEELHAGLRKSYKSLVNKQDAYIPKSQTGYYFSAFKAIHKHLHENKTIRPERTWEIQEGMIEQKQAFLVMLDQDNENNEIAGALFYCNKYTCYYACSASFEGVNTHSVLWQAILFAKRLGCKIIELGEQVFRAGQIMMDGKPATEKHVNISKFKRGFGGECKTRLILEKKR